MAFNIIGITTVLDGKGKTYEHLEATAKSTDTLPTIGIPDGSIVYLYNTGAIKAFDAENEQWV